MNLHDHSTFRDAIGKAIAREFLLMQGGTPEMTTSSSTGDMQLAWAVLATPEMQAIKAFITRMANGPSPKMDRGKRQMEVWEIPESVIEWVLS